MTDPTPIVTSNTTTSQTNTDGANTSTVVQQTDSAEKLSFVEKMSSRHFIQAFFVQLSGAGALYMNIIDGGTYVALSTLALSIYGAASITDKRLNGPS